MLIGITCCFETTIDSRGCPAPRFFLPKDYCDAVLAAGGEPVLLPVLTQERAARMLDHVAGLVISGGAFDIPPSFYGETPHAHLGSTSEPRSTYERELSRAALARDLPLLGVCGGMQLLNVACGGSLYQDLSLRPGTQEHQQPHDRRQPSHPVAVAPVTLLSRVTNATTLEVNSTHHQVVHDVGDGLVVSAIAPDGVVEAVEMPSRRFVLGVQWHPEALDAPPQRAIFRALIAASAEAAT